MYCKYTPKLEREEGKKKAQSVCSPVRKLTSDQNWACYVMIMMIALQDFQDHHPECLIPSTLFFLLNIVQRQL